METNQARAIDMAVGKNRTSRFVFLFVELRRWNGL